MQRKVKGKTNRINFILTFLLIFLSNESLIVSANANTRFTTICYLLVGVFALVTFSINLMRRNRIPINAFVMFIILSFFIVLTAVINYDFDIKYIFLILALFFSLNILILMPLEEFAKHFVTSIVFLSIVSFIASVIFVVLPSFNSLLPSIETKTGHRFVFYIFNNQKYPQDGEYYRNYSIFREPGVFIIYINIALIFTLYFKNHNKIFKYIVLLIACASSLSTAGAFVFAFISIFYFFGNRTKMIKENRHAYYKYAYYFAFGLIAVGLGILVFDRVLILRIFGKVFNDHASTGSRVDSVIINLKLWLESPVSIMFGNGTSFMEDNFLIFSKSMGSSATDNTNTLLKILGVFGPFYFCICVASLFETTKALTNKLFQRFLLFLSIVLLLSNEDIMYNSLLYIFVFAPFVSFKKTYSESVEQPVLVKEAELNENNCCC